VHETQADIEALQALLDRSYAAAGGRLLSIHTPERRLDAAGVVDLLQGICLLALATVSSDGRPFVGPVDGVLFRGAFHFGSAPDSLRFRHIRADPRVSATHLRGEELAVTVHGRAVEVDTRAGPCRDALLEVYRPRYGEGWERFLDSGPVYARIDPERMFAFHAPGEPG